MDSDIQCPECEQWFTVIWNNNVLGGPEYCPMCGAEMDYSKAAEAERGREVT